MVFVSLGAPRRERKGEGIQLPASCLPPPQKEHIPMLLLLQEPHLTTLFDLLEMLACFKPPSPNTEKVHDNPEVGVNTRSAHRCRATCNKDEKDGIKGLYVCVHAECTL